MFCTTPEGNTMKKLISVLVATLFLAGNAFAQAPAPQQPGNAATASAKNEVKKAEKAEKKSAKKEAKTTKKSNKKNGKKSTKPAK